MNREILVENCLSVQYKLLSGMYFDSKKDTENYVLCSSMVMTDEFWNTAYLKKKIDMNILKALEKEFADIKRTSSIYIGRDTDVYYEENRNLLLSNGYVLNDEDVFMALVDVKKVEIVVNIKVVENEKEYNDFMKVLESAYNDTVENATDNVYANVVTECYYNAIKNTINSNEHIHIIAYDDNVPVSVATLNYIDGIGGINNVGTAQGHWNKGYGKQVMAYLINTFEELGGEILTLNTKYQSKNQLFYEKLSFKEKYVIEQYTK